MEIFESLWIVGNHRDRRLVEIQGPKYPDHGDTKTTEIRVLNASFWYICMVVEFFSIL